MRSTPEPQRSIPLTQVVFAAVIEESICTTQVTQVYRNFEKDPIECEYVFPVQNEAAMTDLCVQTDAGIVLKAKIEDAEEAKEGYSDAISSGNQAVLGRMETEDRMVLSVGNMAPRSQVRVTFTLVHPVQCEGKDWSFMLPAVLIPLYNLEESMGDLGIPDNPDQPDPATLTFVRPEKCSYRLHFRLTINSKSPIETCECRSHVVTIDNPAPHLQVTVQTNPESRISANKDFRVTYSTADAMVPHVSVQFDPKSQEYAAMLSFIPPLLDSGEAPEDLTGIEEFLLTLLGLGQVPEDLTCIGEFILTLLDFGKAPENLTGIGEFILILDRSGSMQGSRIEMARDAAVLFIKSLPVGCLFNVISFGDNMELLFPHSMPYDESSVCSASKAVSAFQANMGGTNILSPLRAAFQHPANPSLPRSVYLLTDGAVDNEKAVVQLVAGKAKDARVHAFGIGDGVSTELIKEVAQAGNGIAEFIANPAEVKAKVISVLQKCLAPALTNNVVAWPSSPAQYPSNGSLPTCYFGEVFRVFANFGPSQPPVGTVTLSCRNSKTGQDVSFQVPLGTEVTQGNTVHLLWARKAIKELTYAANTSNPAAKQSVIKISKKYEIPSLYTSFLCVETRTDPVTGLMQHRNVPVVSSFGSKQTESLSNGYSYLVHSYKGIIKKSCRSIKVYKTRRSPSIDAESESHPSQTREEEDEDCPMSREKEHSEVSPLMRLIQSQQIDGSWSLPSLSSFLRRAECPAALSSQYGAVSDSIWATICALLLLSLRYSSQEEEWKLLAGKAKRWLKSQGITDVSAFTEQVTEQLISA